MQNHTHLTEQFWLITCVANISLEPNFDSPIKLLINYIVCKYFDQFEKLFEGSYCYIVTNTQQRTQ